MSGPRIALDAFGADRRPSVEIRAAVLAAEHGLDIDAPALSITAPRRADAMRQHRKGELPHVIGGGVGAPVHERPRAHRALERDGRTRRRAEGEQPTLSRAEDNVVQVVHHRGVDLHLDGRGLG